MKYVQFDEGKIRAIFTSPQDESYWPGVEEVEDDDPRLLAHYAECDAIMRAAQEGKA